MMELLIVGGVFLTIMVAQWIVIIYLIRHYKKVEGDLLDRIMSQDYTHYQSYQPQPKIKQPSSPLRPNDAQKIMVR